MTMTHEQIAKSAMRISMEDLVEWIEAVSIDVGVYKATNRISSPAGKQSLERAIILKAALLARVKR